LKLILTLVSYFFRFVDQWVICLAGERDKAGLGEPVFRYAMISDTHIRPEEGESSSPWKTNLLTNDRARWVVDRVNRADPEFVIHLGDVVHPLPHTQTYGSAAEAALRILGGLEAPCLLLPGNHDVGDKNNPTVPAYVVDDHGLNLYSKWFGPLYSSFDHGGIHFVLINALALNSGLANEDEHSEWLEADLEENRDRRIHMFSHYPPYVLDPYEPSNYDNVDEPERSWLLRLLLDHGVEAFFAGHVHQFLYNRHGATDCYNVLSTCFVRQDYSEMFRVEATEEYGRNDVEKLGYCVVDVYEETHVARFLRSHGSTLKKGQEAPAEAPQVGTHYPREGRASFLGVHLRHPWAEIVDLPYNGPIDEFVRKRVRNDYAVLGLWESGIKSLRVPLADLLEERTRRRIRAMVEMGHAFKFFSAGVPAEPGLKVLLENRELVDSLEVIMPWREAEEAVGDLLSVRRDLGSPIFLANIESSVHRRQEGPKFSHYISHGFRVGHASSLDEFTGLKGVEGIFDGYVFQIGAEESPWDSIKAVGAYVQERCFSAVANVRLASEDPAEYLRDPLRVANRVAESLVAAAALPIVDVYVDTFMDVDRGYFPRVGLYDRRLNRRIGSYVMTHLQGALNEYGSGIALGDRREVDGWDVFPFENRNTDFSLLLPCPSADQDSMTDPPLGALSGAGEKVTVVDLVSGKMYDSDHWRRHRSQLSKNENQRGLPVLCISRR
jgi:predicted phosphodiesterase